MRPMRRRTGLLVALIALVAFAWMAWPYARGLGLVVRAAGLGGFPRTTAEFLAGPVSRHEITIPADAGAMRARVYEPHGTIRRTAVVVPGLHAAGIDEPRFVRLVTELAASGIAVVTPDVPDLARFRFTPELTAGIEAAARWVADHPRYAPDRRVGLIGVSFSGGLAVVAAGRPSLEGRVAYVVSMGGHADLPRVLRYLCTGIEPLPSRLIELGGEVSGLAPPLPHDYGVALILLGLADQLVPPAQVGPLTEAVRRFLWASHLDRLKQPEALVEFAALRERAASLPEPSRTLLKYVNDRDVAHLGARLLPHVNRYSGDAALSPMQSPPPSGPVFLMHGYADNVIPAAEAVHLSEHLRGKAPVHLLLTGLVSHAEADGPVRVPEVLALAGFWGDVLGR